MSKVKTNGGNQVKVKGEGEGKKISKEQQDAFNEFARCVYEGGKEGEDKKAVSGLDAYKTGVIVFEGDLEAGVPVKFKSGETTVSGKLKIKWSRGWEFIED